MDYLNELINLAQILLDRGFDVQDFLSWETAAFFSLLSLLGPFHYYTLNFKRLTSENNHRGLLAGQGILIAAREESLKAVGKLRANE
jgi:hypothetical protein